MKSKMNDINIININFIEKHCFYFITNSKYSVMNMHF